MTDWIDFIVYALFLVGLWFVQPWTQIRLAIPMLLDRNAEWVAAHPDVVRRIERSRWSLWLSFALGTLSLVVLTSLQLGYWFPRQPPGGPEIEKWMVLFEVAMTSMLAALAIGGSIGLIGYYLLQHRIPAARRRQASLERRSIRDFVPGWIRSAVYALALINLAAWTLAAWFGWHSTTKFWARLVIMFGLSGFFWLGTAITVGRRPNAMDRIFGPAYRRGEVRYVFWLQILPPIIGAVRLYEEVTDTVVFDINRTLQILLVLIVIGGIYGSAWLASKLPAGGRRTLPEAESH